MITESKNLIQFGPAFSNVIHVLKAVNKVNGLYEHFECRGRNFEVKHPKALYEMFWRRKEPDEFVNALSDKQYSKLGVELVHLHRFQKNDDVAGYFVEDRRIYCRFDFELLQQRHAALREMDRKWQRELEDEALRDSEAEAAA